MQNCSISIANALEILQFSTKPSIWPVDFITFLSLSIPNPCWSIVSPFSLKRNIIVYLAFVMLNWSIWNFYTCTLRFTAFSILCIEAYFPGFRLYVGSYLMLYLFQLQLHMHGTYQRIQHAFLYETCLHYLCPIYSYTWLRWDTLNGISAHVVMIVTDDLAPKGRPSAAIIYWLGGD